MRSDQLSLFSPSTYPSRAIGALVFITGLILFAASPLLDLGRESAFMDFADKRMWLGVPNTLDVISNIGFLIVGVLGLDWCRRTIKGSCEKIPRFYSLCGGIVFAAVTLTSIGSTYFHLNPSHDSLLWDRLPMTIGFAGLVALLLADRIGGKLAIPSFVAFLSFGLASIYLWFVHDLSIPYAAFQAATIILTALISIVFPRGRIENRAVVFCFGAYLVAKVFELCDGLVFDAISILSGHTIKHVFAAMAILALYGGLKKMEKAEAANGEMLAFEDAHLSAEIISKRSSTVG